MLARKMSLRESYAARVRAGIVKAPHMARTRLRHASAKRSAQGRVYSERRNAFLTVNPYCEACGRAATELHHVRGRVGKLLLDERFWKGLCKEHHDKVHAHPEWARKNGLLASAAEWNTIPLE